MTECILYAYVYVELILTYKTLIWLDLKFSKAQYRKKIKLNSYYRAFKIRYEMIYSMLLNKLLKLSLK